MQITEALLREQGQSTRRFPLLALAILALLAGMWAGLMRLGWALPPLAPAFHGPLISGFLDTPLAHSPMAVP